MGGSPSLEQPFFSLVREIEENLRLTLRSQSTLESAVSAAKSQPSPSQTSLATPSTSSAANRSATTSAGRICFSASTPAPWVSARSYPTAKQTAVTPVSHAPNSARQQLDFDSALMTSRASRTGQRLADSTPPTQLRQPAAGALATPVTPQLGEPFWISNELAEGSSSDKCQSMADAAKTALSRDSRGSPNAAGKSAKRSPTYENRHFGSPIQSVHEKENEAGEVKQSSSRASPKAARRTALLDLPNSIACTGIDAAQSSPAMLSSSALAHMQHHAATLAEEASTANAAVEQVFAAAEVKMQELYDCLAGSSCTAVERVKSNSTASPHPRETPVRANSDVMQRLESQTAEIRNLEYALKEMCACLAQSLRQIEVLERENAALREKVVALESSACGLSASQALAACSGHSCNPEADAAAAPVLGSCPSVGHIKLVDETCTLQQDTERCIVEPLAASDQMGRDLSGCSSTGEDVEIELHSLVACSNAADNPTASDTGLMPATPSTAATPEHTAEVHSEQRAATELSISGSSKDRRTPDMQRRLVRRASRSSWDLPSPSGLSEKAMQALKVAVMAMRQPQDMGDAARARVPRERQRSPLQYLVQHLRQEDGGSSNLSPGFHQ